MTDKQPEALRLADALDDSTCARLLRPTTTEAAALLRTQHAEIERLNACIKWEQNRAERIGTHGPGCEKWGSAHYECLLRSVECKDALLRQALEAITHGCPPGCNDGMTDSGGTYPWGEAVLMPCPACETAKSITKELSQ